MNVLVLMAGKGQRFVKEGYATPKPLIEVNGKTILQWTTESCPYIKHDGRSQYNDVKLHFAVLQEHLETGLDRFLYSIYGRNIEIIPFRKITRGNLETAHIACKRMLNTGDDLLVLDSDNKYNDNNMSQFIDRLPKQTHTMAVMCFDNLDKSLPNKWSNVSIENGVATGIREKDDSWIEHPSLIGTFYFANTDFFINYSSYIINHEKPVIFGGNREYYMSMVPSHLLKVQRVYSHKITDVIPLGTPEDVKQFEGIYDYSV
jgi:NDP-sugar pyrophosphorylase family protein